MKLKIFFLLAILVTASFIYFYKLENYPPSVHCDEIYMADFGDKIIHGGLKNLIGVSWWDVPNMAFLPHGLSTLIVGKRILTPRLPAPVFSILSLIAFFFLVRYLFNTRTAFISVILLSTSHWWISISRAGYFNSSTTLLQIIAYYFIFLSFDKNKKNFIFSILAGIFLGLGNYIYINYRIVFFIISAIFFHKFIFKSEDARSKLFYFKNLILIFFVATLVFSPMLFFYFKNPQTLSSRTKTSFIFSESIKEHMKSVYGTYNKKVWLINNIKKAFDISDKNLDSGLQYGYRGRLLDLTTLVFFILGQVIALINIKKSKYFFILSWFWLSYIALAILTEGVIRNYRLTTVYPAIFLFAGLAMDQSLRFFEVKLKINNFLKNLIYIIFFILILVVVFLNLKIYFYDNQANKIYTFTKIPEMKLYEYLKEVDHDEQLIFISEPYIYPGWCLFWYLTPYLKSYSVTEIQPIPAVNGKKIFIIHEAYKDRLKDIYLKYPEGELIKSIDSRLIIYRVDN